MSTPCPACGDPMPYYCTGPDYCARPAGSVLSACDECHDGAATHIRGDLTVCAACARKWPADVSARGAGWVRCYCGYDRPRGTECGEPCL